MEENEKIRKLRARLEKLEQQEKERAKRQRAVEREKKRKAEVRSAIVLMAILKKMALENETAKRVLQIAVSKVSRPQDRAVLEAAGWMAGLSSQEGAAAMLARTKDAAAQHKPEQYLENVSVIWDSR